MAAPISQSDAEREEHLAQVARLHRMKFSQTEIAKRLNCTQQNISRDLAILAERWRNSSAVDTDAAKREIIAQHELVNEEAWRAWERSQEDAKKTVRRLPKGDAEQAEADESGWIKELTEMAQYGDPRFLEQVRKVQEELAKIYGVNAPTKVAPTDPTGTRPYEGMTVDQLAAYARNLADAVAADTGGTAGGTGEGDGTS